MAREFLSVYIQQVIGDSTYRKPHSHEFWLHSTFFMIFHVTASRQLGLPSLRLLLKVLLTPVLLGACCVTIKSRVTAHENLTQVLEQVENGYPQCVYLKKNVTKTFPEYNSLTRALVSVCIEHHLLI